MLPSQFAAARTARRTRVLLIFPGALGDFLCFLPALLAVRAQTEGRVKVVARGAWLRLIEYGPFEAQSIDARDVAALFSPEADLASSPLLRDFDEIQSWSGHDDPHFQRALRARSTADRVTVHRFRAFAEEEHAVEYYARCLAVQPAPTRLFLGDADRDWARSKLEDLNPQRRPLLVIHGGSGSPAKNWLGFEAVVAWWSARGGTTIELVGPAEEERPRLAGAAPILEEDLRRIAALLELVPLYLGNDSGITHLAGIVGTPGLALFGSSNAAQWCPRSQSLRVLESVSQCEACGPGRFCVHRLSVAAVRAAALTVADSQGVLRA